MKYIIYARKSSESEDRQVLSIDSQVSEMQELARRDGLTVERVFVESMSAKAPGRPVFDEMMAFMETSGTEYGVMTWKLDRLARNAMDGGKLSWFMDRGIIKEIRTWEKVIRNISDDKFFMSLDFGMAKKYVDDLSVNVRRGLRAKLERGEWPGIAPLGYLNDKATHGIFVNERLRPFIIRVYELYTQEGKNTKEIADILYGEGYRSDSGSKLWRSKIHKILINPFYHGVMVRDGKSYVGNHEPIVSKKMFDDAQSVLSGRINPRSKRLFFRFRGLLQCNVCGCALTATRKKGHDYYFCTNGRGHCEQHKEYIRVEELDELIAPILDQLTLDEELIEIAYLAKKENSLNEKSTVDTVRDNLLSALSVLKQKQEKLLDAFLSSMITEEAYQAKLQKLNQEEAGIKADLKNIGLDSPARDSATLEQVKDILLIAHKAKKEFLVRNPERKHELLQTLLWNLKIEGKEIADVSLRMPYSVIAKAPKIMTFAQMLGR
ncbi:MAG TPA: recombinase family protein [Candidatus Fimivivens sp.]|nr:recombinase family protein [Candidatus Fimivivens sp.]